MYKFHAASWTACTCMRAGHPELALGKHSEKHCWWEQVCCETHKFHERVQLDSITSNELGDPDALALGKHAEGQEPVLARRCAARRTSSTSACSWTASPPTSWATPTRWPWGSMLRGRSLFWRAGVLRDVQVPRARAAGQHHLQRAGRPRRARPGEAC